MIMQPAWNTSVHITAFIPPCVWIHTKAWFNIWELIKTKIKNIIYLFIFRPTSFKFSLIQLAPRPDISLLGSAPLSRQQYWALVVLFTDHLSRKSTVVGRLLSPVCFRSIFWINWPLTLRHCLCTCMDQDHSSPRIENQSHRSRSSVGVGLRLQLAG